MVLQGVAQIVLSKLLDKIFYGISKNNIQVELLEGKFVISNIGLQPSLLTQLNLPVQLQYSYVEKVEIHLPWREEEVSLTVKISNIYMLVTTQNTLNVYEIFKKRKERIIEQAIKQFKSNLQKKQNKKEYGYIQRLFLNLLDNVNIKIECIHLRCENKRQNYSLGIKINQVAARTVNQDDKPCFFNREKTKEEYIRYIVEMDFMGIYFNSKEDYYIAGRTYAEITDEFNRLSFKRFRNYSENMESEDATDNFNYIVTVSFKTILKKYINALDRLNDNKEEKNLFECSINLNKIESRISDQQYYDLFDLLDFISDYQRAYMQFVNGLQLMNFKDRKAKDISDLLRKKKTQVIGKRQKQTLKKNCRRYIGWVFKSTYEQILKRTFVKEAIRRQVNVKNLKNNPKTFAIMNKIDNQKLKLWVIISLYYRQQYQERVSFFLRGSLERQRRFADKFIDSFELFEKLQFQGEIEKHRQNSNSNYQVFLKLTANIQQFNFQISRENNLGVYFNMQKLRAELTLKERNYFVKLFMQDLQADVFHCNKNQKLKTYVPIIKRNCILDKTVNLLQVTYERNPVGKPFVFTQIDARFQSIEITIYPQAFKQFYEILLGDGKDESKKKKKTSNRRQQSNQNQNDSRAVRRIGFQKTIIKAKIKTPWIVLPFSPINNPAQECWVARLGDFYIDTPEYDYNQIKTQEQIFYEQYKLQLKRFELSYFSSINLFYNWIKFNHSLQNLHKIKSFAKEQIITMIEPFSCFVELSLLKNSLSQAIKDRKPKITAKIMIDEIQVKVSKFLMGRLKSKVDNILDEGAELDEFIETNVQNIREQNQLSGYCKISYEGIKKINFYCILKGSYMYFFMNENYYKYHFFVNLNEVSLRLISNQVQNFNTHHHRLLCFYLGDRQKHQHWRKKILHVINKKTRRNENSLTSNFRNTSVIDIKEIKPKQSLIKSNEKLQENQSQSHLKLSAIFLMNKLSIQLFDQQDKPFLNCNFKKATVEYSFVSERSLKCSLNEWTVREGDGQLFIGSNSFFEEQSKTDVNSVNNFLEVYCGFNSITEELKNIDIKVDKLFLAWKVELFTNILLFFFYDQEAADAPTPFTFDKRQLQVKISFQKFTFYCYFADQLLALTKLQLINIRYFQNNIEEIYDVKCQVFEIDKYVNGSLQNRVPMIRRKNVSLDDSNDQLIQNPFNLSYVLRKRETQSFEDICRLKKLFGDEVLVSQTICEMNNTEIYFENELTFRILNYFLNKVLGTVASKFKKRDYSPNYIFESLKLCKISIFDISLNNCIFKMPPHERGQREFSLEVARMRVSKNIDQAYMPSEVIVKTINSNQRLFWESMVINIANAQLYYHYGMEEPIAILATPINMNLIYSKLNFQKEYFVILNHHDDIDRKNTLDVIIEEPVVVEAHKIMFVTFLQLFYQNIKHKDGKADIFEPPLPFPALRQYSVYIQKVGLNMYHFHQRAKSMEAFNRFLVDRFKVFYKQIGQQSTIRLEGQTLGSSGQLPIYSLDPRRKKFLLEMNSKESEMKVVINVEQYVVEADLDKLNNIIQFLNYDNDHVSNKIMPKKSSSWQYVNVFAKNCQLRLGVLRATGQFYISYIKGMKNDPDLAAKEYLFSQQDYNLIREDSSRVNWEDLTDKEIKVHGQQVKLSIHGDAIGGASSFYFNRYDLTCKSTNRRYKKEKVQVGEGGLHVQLIDLLTIWQVYNTYIKKKTNFQLNNFYQPYDHLAVKSKVVEKRSTQVKIQGLSINILTTREVEMLRYIRIYIQFPSIAYRTFKDEQEVLVNIAFRIFHHKQKMKEIMIGQCKSLRIHYLNWKEKREKSINIVHGKDVVLNLIDLNNKAVYSMIEQAKSLKKLVRNYLHIDSSGNKIKYGVVFQNQSPKRVKINISNAVTLTTSPYSQESASIDLQHYLEILTSSKSFIEVQEEGSPIIRKNASEINMYQSTLINSIYSLLICSTPQSTKFIYKPIYSLTNHTSCSISLKDKRTLACGQSVYFVPNKYSLQFDMKQKEWWKAINISHSKDEQLFGEDCFVSYVKRQQHEWNIQLMDRFIIKNMTLLPIQIGNKQINAYEEVSLGYVAKNLKDNFPLKTGKENATIDLTDSSNQINYNTLIIQKSNKMERRVQCRLKTELQIAKNMNILSIYSQFTIRNKTKQQLVLFFMGYEHIVKPNAVIILPKDQQQTLRFRQQQKLLQIVFDKNKQFFSNNFKFTLQNRLSKKITIINIESKHTILNSSNHIIDIMIEQQKMESIMPGETYQLTTHQIHSKFLTLVFAKFYQKRIDITKTGINFLQIQQEYYKLTLLSKEESLLIIEESKKAHKITNKLDEISIIAHSYQNYKSNHSIDNSDQSISKLIKGGQSEQIGLFSWGDFKIELQFYLQGRNIEFKQKFIVDFQELDYKFSYKHIVYDQKDKKNVFFLIITLEKDTDQCFTITAYKQKDYFKLPIQKMKFSIQQLSLSLMISNQVEENVTIQCYKACLVREKGIQLTDFDIQIEKFLIRQGKNVSIFNALDQSKFINTHLILSKTSRATVINNLMIKLAPLELICREKIIFKVLQKIVQIRAQSDKSREQSLVYYHYSKNKNKSKLVEQTSLIAIEPSFNEAKLQKRWQDIKKQRKSKILIINNLQLSQTSLFATYTKEEYKQFDEKIATDPIIKYMILIPSISELKISIPHFKITDFTGEPKQLAKEVVGRLKQSIGGTIANSFSALPFFDNPIIAFDGLFKYIDGMLSIQ